MVVKMPTGSSEERCQDVSVILARTPCPSDIAQAVATQNNVLITSWESSSFIGTLQQFHAGFAGQAKSSTFAPW